MSRSEERTQFADARARARDARMQFADAVQATKARLTPAHLKEDARQAVAERLTEAKQTTRRAIRRHPLLTGAAVAGLAASLFWKPARSVAVYGMRASQFIWLNRNLWRSTNDET